MRGTFVRGWFSYWVPPLIAGVGILTAWAITAAMSDPTSVPSPSGTLRALVDGFRSDAWATPLRETLTSVGVAYVLALALGLCLGMALGSFALVRRAVEPIISTGYAVPKVILFPIFLVVFGVGSRAQISLGLIAAFFPVLFFTVAGRGAMPIIYTRVARSLNAPPHWRLWKFYLPAIMPSFLIGAQIALASCLINVTFTELRAGERGLGAQLSQEYNFADLEGMAAVGFVIFCVGLLGTGALVAIGRAFGVKREFGFTAAGAL